MIKKITLLLMLFFSTLNYSQTTLNSEDFQTGNFGSWNDGGTYCTLESDLFTTGNFGVRLNHGAADVAHTAYSNPLDLSPYTTADISFDFQTAGLVDPDDFYLEYNSGSGWEKIGDFNVGFQFTDGIHYSAEKVSITSASYPSAFSAATSFRFRSSSVDPDAATNYIYIDNILVEGSGTAPEGILAGANWKYLDNGTDQGTAWRDLSFNDSGWAEDPALFGYGTIDGGTIITTLDYGTDENNKYITTYFRKEFSIADKSLYQSIDLEAVRDDGIVVYLNGTEVWRDNMQQTGAISYNTLAGSPTAGSPAIGGTDESAWNTNSIASTFLVDGTNVIAVEIHQQALNSSDISFNFKLTPSTLAVGAATVIRGPYLQTGTPTSVVVKWRTNNPTNSIVNYGTTLGALSTSESNTPLTTEHEVTLTGLSASTKYYYEIADGDGTNVLVSEDSEMFVKTSPPHGTKQFVRMWALGDPGTANDDQRNVRDSYYNYVNNSNSPPVSATSNIGQTDMMLFLGDNAYNDGTDAQFQAALFDIYDAILPKTVAWSCLGNHEAYVNKTDPLKNWAYYDIFTFPTAGQAGGLASGSEEYYSFDYANIHFIVLESFSMYEDAGQIAWLTSDIQNTSQDWIIAFFHHPPYTKGSHNSDDHSEEGGMDEMREDYLPILEMYGVDLVLSGHSHSYERSFFINGHYGDSDTFNAGTHKIQTGDGKIDGNGEYLKTTSTNGGAVYVVTGSAGKKSGFNFDGFHEAMYISQNQLGSSVIEVGSDGSGGQNLTLKFITDTGNVNDYFTINKSSSTLSTETYEEVDNKLIKIFPVPAKNLLNIDIANIEKLKKVSFYNAIGALVKETNKKTINVSMLKSGMYMVLIETDQNNYYKSIIIE